MVRYAASLRPISNGGNWPRVAKPDLDLEASLRSGLFLSLQVAFEDADVNECGIRRFGP